MNPMPATQTLFGEAGPEDVARTGRDGSAPGEAFPGPFAAVALEQSIDRTLDYAVPASLIHLLKVGQRVRVPLGKKNRPISGYVIAIRDETTHPARRIKRLIDIADDRVLVPPTLMALCDG